MDNISILVVIVSYNSMRWAKNCYNSLRSSTVRCDVLTVDNGSTDGTVEYIRINYPEVRIIEAGQNLGFGKANNIGLQIAKDEGYDYVYLLNQDAWVLPDTFERLIQVSQAHEEYGVLSPMQMKADLQHLDDNYATYVIGCHQKTRPYFVEDLYMARVQPIYEVSFVMAAHWMITKKCLATVGGFSPSFPHYGEDDNYLQRVNYWGMKAGIVPEAKAVHDRADSHWSAEKNMYIHQYIDAIKIASNPLSEGSIWDYIKGNAKVGIKRRNKQLWNYAVRLFKERNVIAQNTLISKKQGAFLQ